MPLHNWSPATFAIGLAPIALFLALGCWGRAEEIESGSAANQPVTVEEMIERLEQVEAKLHGFRVHCLSTTKQQNLMIGVVGEGLEEIFGDVSSSRTTTNAVWHYRNDGSWRFQADLVQMDVTEGGDKQTKKFSAYSVFDGPRGRGKHLWLNSPDSDMRVSGNDEEVYSSTFQGYRQSRPREFLTHSWGSTFSDELSHDEARITRREMLDGRALIVLTTKVLQFRSNFQQYREFWIDFERGVVVRRQTFVREADDSPWVLQRRQESGAYEWNAGSGLWLPTSAKKFEWRANGQGQGKLIELEVFAYSGWKINPPFDPQTFSIDQSWYSPNDRR